MRDGRDSKGTTVADSPQELVRTVNGVAVTMLCVTLTVGVHPLGCVHLCGWICVARVAAGPCRDRGKSNARVLWTVFLLPSAASVRLCCCK